ncbi:MAG: DNA polymerase [Akkermansiaceae bacterium]
MIAKPQFIIPLFNPVDLDSTIRVFLTAEDMIISEVECNSLNKQNSTYISFNPQLLLRSFGDVYGVKETTILDIDLVLTLLRGKPKRLQYKNQPTTFIEYLKKLEKPEHEPYLAYCFKGVRKLNEKLLLDSIQDVANCLNQLWLKSQDDLRSNNEFARYWNIEVPVSQIMARSQIKGIRISSEFLQHCIGYANKSITESSYILRIKFGIIDAKNIDLIKRAIDKDPTLSGVTEDVKNHSGLQSLLKLYSKDNELADTLKKYHDACTSKLILLRCGGVTSSYIHPDFNIIGTVTGRITVQTPSIQTLAKKFRSLIIADENKILLYPDFAQCEPGILANDSLDENFIRDYNTKDIYVSLSLTLFNSEDYREEAKLIFLFFCYGMSNDRIIGMICNITKSDTNAASDALLEFFSKYSKLAEWRQSLIDDLYKTNRIGTALGNYRYFSSNESISSRLRGAQSQRIQGSASLILKKIIIKINNELPEIDILLPMHDALLLQVPKDDLVSIKKQVDDIFCECYREVCPFIQPKVKFDDFAVSTR